MTIDLNAISGYAALALTLIYIYKGWAEGRKTTIDGRKSRADAFTAYEVSIQNAVERAFKTQERLSAAEDKIEKQDIVIHNQEIIITRQSGEIDELRQSQFDMQDWAERLSDQVRARDEEPVKLIKGVKKKGGDVSSSEKSK